MFLMKKRLFLVFSVALLSVSAMSQQKKFMVHTVAFYNFENLFDTINGPNYDEEWLPDGKQNWTGKKYKQKLENLSRVLAELGTGESQKESPVLIGCSEVENRGVLEDLVKQPNIINKDYGIVHFDSPDKRGIDVALLYKKKHFQPTSYKNIPLMIYEKDAYKKEKEADDDKEDNVNIDKTTKRIYTRDQLLVTGLLDGEEVHVIVNHWPSRSGGEKKSSPNREAAGRLNRKIMDSLYAINPNAKIISMGDLNDGSFNKSVKVEVGAKGKKEDVKPFGVYNPMQKMAEEGMGTLAYRDAWDLFDIIMVSEPLIRNDYSSWRYWKAGIYNKPFLVQKTGQYKGYPLRNSNGEVGFSDHFPVYIYLIKEAK
ncbi:endonuclease [Flavobacterium suncheonense GH29-5 = DSM 17707]|uniref:Endonuclease n=2 Tax=Flavobacterium suncheonense TaxID=350894 RepID=A0A0A2MLL1_9FLAO|nr:endonuclease [Flavobacterium suncheonense GH29-5 = DSM 17707]